MGKRSRNRAGRKRDPDAQRNQTTLAGRIRNDNGTPELLALRRRVSGDERIGFGFPLDVLVSHGLITEEMRDEGLRFAGLAWWLYGTPAASCQGLYERMVAEGLGQDFAPRPEGEEDDEARLKRIASQKSRFERMTRALATAPSRLPSVKRICQFLELPTLIKSLAGGGTVTADAHRQMARLAEGLERLVDLRKAEDRHHSRSRSRPEVRAG